MVLGEYTSKVFSAGILLSLLLFIALRSLDSQSWGYFAFYSRVNVGMSREEVKHLNDADAMICPPLYDRSEHLCTFSDDVYVYIIDFGGPEQTVKSKTLVILSNRSFISRAIKKLFKS